MQNNTILRQALNEVGISNAQLDAEISRNPHIWLQALHTLEHTQSLSDAVSDYWAGHAYMEIDGVAGISDTALRNRAANDLIRQLKSISGWEDVIIS